MGEISQRIKAPYFAEVIYLNYRLIKDLGGHYEPPFNLLNKGSLIWALERICAGKVFGIDLYPTFADKAALLVWTIINDHVFNDGCKRTGFVTAMVFLSMNEISFSAEDNEIYKIAKRVATYYKEPVFTFQNLADWFQEKIA